MEGRSKMTNLGMGVGINGSVRMDASTRYLDFAPEPPAPTAAPVTEYDRRDLSNPQDAITLDYQVAHQMHIQNQQQQQQQLLHQQLLYQQQQQQQQTEVEQYQSSMHGVVVTPGISGMMSQNPGTSQMSDIYRSDATEDSTVVRPDGSSMQYTSLTSSNASDLETPYGNKMWSADDMESALDALRTQNMSLTKASATYGIPPTTLWQRAHRLGIVIPKHEPSRKWTEESLNSALEALRTGTISANKASKVFGIPSSTLYKIARREGIRLAVPFNATPTAWSAQDLDRALGAIKARACSVQIASTYFGIPIGTLYGRCKREGIELPRLHPKPWSEDTMMEALECVKQGHMSINQVAIHFKLPYGTLYGRLRSGKSGTPNSAKVSSHSNHGDVGGTSGTSNVGGVAGNVVTSAATKAGATSSPQMEFIKLEPQHNEPNPANMQHYNPALTSFAPSSIQTHHVAPSPSQVNMQIIVNTNHHQLQQPQLIQQHHSIYQQSLQQSQQQPQYHPM